MLAVFLKVLSIIGIILLAVLGIAILLVLLVLFAPISYRAQGVKNAQQTKGEAKARWLFGLARAVASYNDGLQVKAKLLWVTLYEAGGEEPPKGKRRGRSRKSGRKQQKVKEAGTGEKQPEESLETEPQAKDTAEKLSKFEKIKYTIGSTYDKIKNITEKVGYYKKIWEDPDTRILLNHVLFRLGRMLKALKPRHFRADILFGTGSPDTTGYAYGVYGMLSPHLGSRVVVTPDFEQAVLEGEVYLDGRVTVFAILIEVLKLVLDKRFRAFMDKLKQADE